jgi:hypothetical protein
MIEQIQGLPPGTLGFSATGKLTAQDYESVIVPDIEAAFAVNRKLRILFQLGPNFTGFEAGAMWDDLKLGFRHFSGWDRVAVVTDLGWIRTTTRTLGFLAPAEMRLFSNAEFEQARTWIAEPFDSGEPET